MCKVVPSDFPECGSSPARGTMCSVDVASETLRPTQALVGMLEIQCKTDRYASMSSDDLQKYWGKHVVPAVVGPGGDLFITDHHHSTLALLRADRKPSDRLVLINVTHNFESEASLAAFWSRMLDEGLLWLFDDKDRAPMHPNLLPTTLLRMVNDPYRSLVWGVRNNGGYGVVDSSSYQDFLYAQFLRQYDLLPAPGAGRRGTLRGAAPRWSFCEAAPFNSELCYGQGAAAVGAAIGKAVSLARSDAAKDLPGWGQGQVDYPDCGNATAV